jgi:hypothetical protein
MKRPHQAIVITLGILSLGNILCAGCVTYAFWARWIESWVCIQRAAYRLDVQPEPQAIFDYANRSLSPGMTSQQVRIQLEKIAPIRVGHRYDLQDGSALETIELRLCAYSWNNLLFDVMYDAQGGMKRFELSGDD